MELIDSSKLNQKCSDISIKSENPKSHLSFFEKLVEHAIEWKGVGLAAPQVGIFRKEHIWKDKTGTWNFSINPAYYPDGKTAVYAVEGCLSLSGQFVVPRYKKVRAVFWTISEEENKFTKRTLTLRGDDAITFQHETDHVFGVLISDRGVPYEEWKKTMG